MKLQVHLSSFLATLFSLAWVDCANVSCASMRSWFPGTLPSNFADKSPFELSISGHTAEGYFPGSSHTVYLNGSMTGDNKIRSFIGFIVYAENSVKHYTNGRFVKEDLPAGVEEASCGDLYIIENSTSSGSWTSVKMLWKAPKDGHLAGNITFRASVLEKTNPLTYYEGFTAHLKYQCPLRKCVACPGSVYKYDSYGCQTCQCGACDFFCAGIYDPVCGTDGKTYSNECSMKLKACTQKKFLYVDYKGECRGCKSVYTCTVEYAPVCGTDGKTYSNQCIMEAKACENKKNITVSYKGECKGGGCDFVCGMISEPVCGTDNKTYDNECSMKLDACTKKKVVSVDYKGKCIYMVTVRVVLGCTFPCTEEYAPVCGTDGKTYSNQCIMEAKACKDKKNIAVSYKGECKNGAEKLRVSVLSLMFSFLALLWFSV